MIAGETVGSGASAGCSSEGCPGARGPMVCRSGAGYYIGYWCDQCGPYSRESLDYYKTEEDAEDALRNGTWEVRAA